MTMQVKVSDHFQIAPQDRDDSLVIRVTSTVSVTAVNCVRDLEVHFCSYVKLMSICPDISMLSSRIFEF